MALSMAAATLGGSVLSGITSFLGASSQNKANQAIAASQMAFQERMSGTAYQRAVKDMRLAGINPMLAYSKGGATTPGGAGLPMVNTMGGLSKVVSSALQMRRLNAETDKLEADRDLSREVGATESFKRRELLNRAHLTRANEKIVNLNMSSARAQARIALTRLGIAESKIGQFMQIFGTLFNPLGGAATGIKRLTR